MEPYTYQPLDGPQQIRMMILEPAKKRSAPLRCSLVHQAIDGEPFEALSYVWGSTEDLQILHCEGKSIRITKNLDQALREVRKRSDEVRIWVDAVCINQKDIDEKSVQIKLMTQIYSLAKHCVIWLDPKESISLWAVMVIKVSHALFPPDERHVVSQVPGKRKRYRFLLLKVFLARRQSVRVIEGLCACEWFYRVWTFQEVLMSREPRIVCQGHRIPWRAIDRAITALGKPGTATDGTLNWRFECWKSFQASPRGFHRVEIAYDIRRLRATQAADQVIGAKAILEQIIGHDIPLEYHQTVPELYATVSRAILRFTNELDFLLKAAIYQSTPDLPSWCIDWSSWSEKGEVLRRKSGYWESRAPDSGKRPDYKLSMQHSDVSQIGLGGSRLGSVLAHAGQSHFKNVQVLAGAISNTTARETTPHESFGILLNFLRFHRTNIKSAAHQLAQVIDSITLYQAWIRWFPQQVEELLEQSSNPEPGVEFGSWKFPTTEDLEEIVVDQAFFIMDNRHLGCCWCAVEIVEGDVIFAPVGEKFLIIVRPVNGQEHSYRYLGPAIVHGCEDHYGCHCCDDRIELGEEMSITLV